MYTVLQGGLVLWHPLSPAAVLWFVAIAPSSYLTGLIACSHMTPPPLLSEHIWRGKQQLLTIHESLEHRQAPRVSGQKRGKGINLLAVVGP